MTSKILCVVTFVFLIVSTVVSASTPQMISYQGHITKSNGDPLDSVVAMHFAIYDAPTMDGIIWQETHGAVAVVGGAFTILLGSMNPISDGVFADSVRWLGIKIGNDAEISPRTRLVSVPWTFRVSTVDGASGGSLSGDLAVSGKGTFGFNNLNTGTYSFVAGADDTVSAGFSSIGGGQFSRVSGTHSVIAGGYGNVVTPGSDNSAIVGGVQNYAQNIYSFVGGGAHDTASGQFSVIGGGEGNRASGNWSSLGGGTDNKSSGEKASVGGGAENTAGGWGASVAGGIKNVAAGTIATVAGGGDNVAGGHYSTVAGGQFDTASSFYATVGGGERNTASGQWSTVPGGMLNSASADFAFAFGRRAKANHFGSLVWADGEDADLASTAANQFLVRASGGVGIGTNAPAAPLHVNGIIYSSSGGFKFPDGTIQTSAAGAGGNADMVDGFHASATPTPNALLPLDASGHFVLSGSNSLGVIRGNNPLGRGVYGEGRYGIYGSTSGNDPVAGVYGECTKITTGNAYGVQGIANNTQGSAIGGDFSSSIGGVGEHFGIRANSAANNSVASRAVQGYASNSGSGDALGADFWAQTGGTGSHFGVLSNAQGGNWAVGIYASASGGTTNHAGYFSGNVAVTGTLSKGGGSFKIDHPLDPENKYLYHSFVESPDMKNVYDGVSTLDETGSAVVLMPEYFEALNRDFRYQLTCIGEFAPVYVSEKIDNNRFTIAGGKPGLEVSWQVTGIRKDAFAEHNRIPTEVQKNVNERGKYLYPEAWGKPTSMGIDYSMQRPIEGDQRKSGNQRSMSDE